MIRGRRRAAVGLVAAALLVGCATAYFEVDEAIRFEDGETRFVAFAQRQRGWLLGGVKDVEVRFSVAGREVASAVTDERGFAKAIADVDTGGERFTASAAFDGQDFQRESDLVDWSRDRVIVVCDIDATISQTSLTALFFHEIDETSQPIPGSPEVMTKLAEAFQLLYVSARPRFTLEKTRSWVQEHGYPIQPVVTSLSPGDALGQTTYKTRTLNSLRKHYGNLLIGIGNTDIDAESYAIHGMLVLLVQPDAEPGHDGAVLRFQNWAQIDTFFTENLDVLRDPARLRAAIAGEVELRVPDQR